FGFLQNGNFGVGVFPQREEIFVGGKRPNAGGIGVRALRGLRLKRVRTSHSQMRQRSRPAVPDDAAVVENLLKFGGGSTTLSRCQVGLPTYIHVIEAGNIGDELNLPQLDGGSSLRSIQGGSRILFVQRQLCLNRRQPKRLHLSVQRVAFPQVLGQGLGSRRLASHCKRQRGFHPGALTFG